MIIAVRFTNLLFLSLSPLLLFFKYLLFRHWVHLFKSRLCEIIWFSGYIFKTLISVQIINVLLMWLWYQMPIELLHLNWLFLCWVIHFMLFDCREYLCLWIMSLIRMDMTILKCISHLIIISIIKLVINYFFHLLNKS